MISVVIEQSGKEYRKILCQGHAGYAKSGEDIVCAAVSILVINTLNAIERFTETDYDLESDGETGYIEAVFEPNMTREARLLLDAMVMGLEEISRQYQSHISLRFTGR